MRRLCHPAEGETSSVAAALAAPAVSSLEAWRRRLARSEELQESAQAVETIQASSASVKADAPTTQSMKTGPPPRCAHSSPPVYPGWAAQTHHPTRPTPETYSYAKPATATTSPARKIRLTEQAFRAGRPAARSPIDADGMTVAFKVYEESPPSSSDQTERMSESVEGDETSAVAALAASASQTSAIAAFFASERADRCARGSEQRDLVHLQIATHVHQGTDLEGCPNSEDGGRYYRDCTQAGGHDWRKRVRRDRSEANHNR